jgi:hypothetical protein
VHGHRRQLRVLLWISAPERTQLEEVPRGFRAEAFPLNSSRCPEPLDITLLSRGMHLPRE